MKKLFTEPSLIRKDTTRVRKTLWPPQRGTRYLKIDYGKHLVCVRYRYDGKRRKRYTTVELIVDEKPWRRK